MERDVSEHELRQRATVLRDTIRRQITDAGDNYARAEYDFRGYSHDEMIQPHGRSGRTRRQVLDTYRDHRQLAIDAETLLESMLAGRGL